MRILLAALHPPGGCLPIGGVQSWICTVAAELARLGHQAAIWGPEWPVPEIEFDLGVLANLPHTAPAERLCSRLVRISHGIVPDEAGGPGFLATSEEVRDRWNCDGVIRQPIDLDFWSPGAEARTLLTQHSYRGGLPFLSELATSLGLEFAELRQASPEVVRNTLRRSAVVVATGRAAVEAMACGAAVVVADDREYQGPLYDPDPVGAMGRNYSGRGGRKATRSQLQLGLGRALRRGSLRAHAERHHDARIIVQELLCCIC